jgi:cytochrome c2
MRTLPALKLHLIIAVGVVGGATAALDGCSGDDSNPTNPGQDAGRDATSLSDATSPTVDGGPGPGRDGSTGDSGALPGSAGPDAGAQQFLAPKGTSVTNGQTVFRFETFGNEGYWTRVLELPQGMKALGVTPAQAIAAGISIDSDATPDLTKLPSFNDPANTEALVEANAVIGLSARNVTTLNGKLDIDNTNVYAGESVGVSCAFCHSITDGSVLSTPTGGSIGKRVDGPTNHNLQVGKAVALANRSRAFYPTLALDLVANNHGSVSRKGAKSATNPLILPAPTETEVDAYLNDATLYPVGMFDDAPDGNGAPVHITPMFRADLSAPWGSEGSIHMLQNFGNLVFTALLDPTDLIGATPPPSAPLMDGGAPFTGAQVFEYDRGGAAGLELIANYKNIIEKDLGILPYSATNPNGYPFVGRTDKGAEVATGLAAGAKIEPSPIGIQVNQAKLLDMNAYLYSMRSPIGKPGDAATIRAGRILFRQNCTSCHNDDQSKFVPENIVAFNAKVDLYANAPTRPDLFAGWNGAVLAQRPGAPFAALVPLRDSPGIFDDKMIVIEASDYAQPRGNALPLLLDLARKPVFLHDNEVTGATPSEALSNLLDPVRGADAPHAFYFSSTTERAAMVTFLQSLDDRPLP